MTTQTGKWIERLHAALDWAIASDTVPEESRPTIRRALEAALLDAVAAEEKRQTTENDGKSWLPDQLEALKGQLEKMEPPRSFHECGKALDILSRRFKRSPHHIERKASEMGMGDKVDYWLAKQKHGWKE